MSSAEEFSRLGMGDDETLITSSLSDSANFGSPLEDNSGFKFLLKALRRTTSAPTHQPEFDRNESFNNSLILDNYSSSKSKFSSQQNDFKQLENWQLFNNISTNLTDLPFPPLNATSNATTDDDSLIGSAKNTNSSHQSTSTPSTKHFALQPTTSAATPTSSTPTFAIKTEGTFTANGSSSFDINPADIQDDALIYAAKGFTINGNPTLPVIRNAQGNPITNSSGKLILANNAVTVAPGYTISNASTNRYANLLPPQVITPQSVILPNYSDIKQQELHRRTPPNTNAVTFNTQNNPINNASQWASKFPTGGTPTSPTIVRVINGGLNIPSNVNLNNYIITVDSGDINFNGNNQNLNNTVLITNNGNINLSNILAKDLSVFSSGAINTNGGARFSGQTLFANNSNSNIIFNGATATTNPSDNLTIISAGNITYNGASNTRGAFLSAKDFTYNGSSTLSGGIKTKGNIIFNGNANIAAAIFDITSPDIIANLTNDTGTSNTDKITFDPTITGKLTDTSLITAFKVGIDSGNYINILNQLTADSSFTLNRTTLQQIIGSTIPDGVHTLHFIAQDLYGNTSNTFDFTFTLDTTAPTAPIPTLLPESDSGISNSDRLTKFTTPKVAGNSESGTIVKVFDGSQLIGQTTTTANGTWQTVTTSLTSGNHTLSATATDIAGNTSPKGTPLDITVDSIVPTLSLTAPVDTTPLTVGTRLTGTVNGTLSNITSLEYRFDDLSSIGISLNSNLGFDQVLDFTGLNNGSHSLTITATDAAGNVTATRYNVTVIIDTTGPQITANLVNDTGNDLSDRITTDSTIIGKVTDASGVVELLAGFNDTPRNNFTNIIPQRQADGSFTLTRTILESIKGGSLPDGTHTLHLVARDEYGNESDVIDFTFTLDTTPPEILNFTLHPDSDSGEVGDNQTRVETVTLVGQTEPNINVILQETGATTTSDSTGRFELTDVSLAMGDNLYTLKTTDIAGNSSTFNQTIKREECYFDNNLTGWTVTQTGGAGSVVGDKCEAVLREGNSFDVTLSRIIEIPTNPSILTFTYAEPIFDTAAVNQIKDAFEVALVDAEGRSLVHSIGNGKSAFFNITEGQTPQLAAGVTINGQTVSLDLSQLIPGTAATLQLRLVNNDNDINTFVRISEVKIQSSDAGVPPVVIPVPNRNITSELIDFTKLSDVSASLSAIYGQTSFNEDSKILSSDLTVKNAGEYPVKGKLLVGVTNISDPTVRLRNADGKTPEGISYIDFTKLLKDGTLLSFESTSDSRRLEFDNPSGVQFTYDLVFLSQVNSNPEFTTNPDVEAIVGKPYIYDADALDADKDSLTYSVLSGPDGLVVDSATGKITWNPTAGDIGNHNVIVKVKDNFGGEATQQYNLSTINPPPNRPPLFTSIPVVDAKVNTLYKYEAKALDDDGNPLTFSLLEAPAGMTVNPNTGVLTWVPDGHQLGKLNIKLKVEDSAGGTAEQSYQILTQIEPGNHAPFIVSEPITQFNFPGSANPHSGNVSPQGIDLNLETGQVIQSPISLTLPYVDTTTATDTVFVVDLSTSMGNEVKWVGNLIQNLEAALSTRGLNSNRYAIVGFADDGQYVNLNAGGNDLNITLYGPSNQWLGSRTIFDGLLPDSLFETTLPTNGNYTLLLTSPNAIGSTGYDFQLQSSSNLLDTGNGTPATSTTTIQPLNLNVPITGSIASATEKDIFTFKGTPGQLVYYDALEVPDYDGINVSLLSPTGNLILNFSSSDYDSNLISLTESGTYSLIFQSYGTTGDYNFQLLQPEETKRLSFNTQITGRLDSGFKKALYHFDATPGQRLYFDSLANANGSWYLYGPNNQYLTNNSLSYDFEVTLPHAGSYTLIVAGDNYSSGAVDYNFKVWSSPTTPVLLNLNTPITGSIDVPGEVDVFTFSGTSGTKLYYDALEADGDYLNAKLVSPSGTTIFETNSDYNSNLVTLTETGKYHLIFDALTQTTGDYQFQLLAPGLNSGQNLSTPVTASLDSGLKTALYQFNGTAGTQLVFDSLANANGYWYLYKPDNQYLSGTSLSNDFSATLPVNGAYTLMVFGDNYTTDKVNYSFKVNAPTPVVTANSTATSNSSMMPLQLNVPITGSINSATEKDIFTFNGTPGQVVYYDALEAFDNDGINVSLLSPTGNLILNPSSSDYDSNLISLTEAGTYSLIFQSYGSTGDYNFQLLQPEETKRLSFNTPIIGRLDSGFKKALYHFDATPGQRFYFDSLINANGSWTLYGPNNQSIYGDSLWNDFEVTLPHAGSYTLMVAGDNYSNNPVNYNFRLQNSPTTVEQLNLNAPVNKEIALAGEVDVFTFEGTSGTTLYYDALEEYDYDNISVTLVSPSGYKLIDRNTDYDSSLFTLTETGTYRLIIDPTFRTLKCHTSTKRRLNSTDELRRN